jgi:chromosome segregation ATPase
MKMMNNYSSLMVLASSAAGARLPDRIKRTSPRKVRFALEPLVEDWKAPSTTGNKPGIKSALRGSRSKNQKTRKVVVTPEPMNAETKLLTMAASMLEKKVRRIQGEQKEELEEIQEWKNREMAKIYRECKAERKVAKKERKELEESSSHDNEVVHETILTLRDHNKLIRKENKQLEDDIEELKVENILIFEQTARYYKASESLKEESVLLEERKGELEEAEHFLRMRKNEYETARFEADEDIATANEEAKQLRSKLENMVAHIVKRCSNRDLSSAIYDAVEKDFASHDAPVICA